MARRQLMLFREVETEMPFPLEGMDVTRAYLRQRPGTCVNAQNVRSFEPATDRARGGQRHGLTKYVAAQVSGSNPVQDINHLTTYGGPAPTGVGGQVVYALTAGNGFGLAAGTTGVSQWTAGAVSGYAFACSCWDGAGNLYVAEVNVTTGAVNVYCITAGTGAVVWTTATTVLSGSLRAVAGMTVIGTTLYVALTSVGNTITNTVGFGAITNVASVSGSAGSGVVTNALGSKAITAAGQVKAVTSSKGTGAITNTPGGSGTISKAGVNGIITSAQGAGSITQVNCSAGVPMTVTSPSHGLVTGQTVVISGVTVNAAGSVANGSWVVTVTSVNTFTLNGNGDGTTGIGGGWALFPIRITSANHGRATGDKVLIGGVKNNTYANGIFTITVVNGSTFTLNNSVSNGAYNGGGFWALQTPIRITSTAHGLSTGAVVAITGVGGVPNANITVPITVVDANTFTLNATVCNGAYTSGGAWALQAPIRITSTAHGLTTGQQVFVSGVVGNTSANGTWTVTVIDANTVTLQSTVNSGVYVSGGTWALAPIIVTSTAHGLTTGTQVTVSGVTGNTNANATTTVTVIDANTFSLDGTTANGSSAGTGIWISQNPITITSATHGLSTGQVVKITGVLGNTAANGNWTITVVDANTFTLNGSIPTGLYTSGGTWFLTPIVITAAAHGLSTGQNVTIASVGGNTAANGNWIVTVIDANTFSLNTTLSNAAYTSGGTWTGHGLISVTSAAHGLTTAQTVVVASVGGTTNANGNWTITVVDANTFTLNGSSFNSAYTSGGTWGLTPIIVTSANHLLTTGQSITITGVGGNTAANSTWTVTVIDANTFSLNTSTANGVYTTGGSWINSGAAAGKIATLSTTSGAMSAWRDTGNTPGLVFSNAAVNCLGSVGTLLGVDCIATGTGQCFKIIDTAASPQTAPLTIAYGGTASNRRSKVVSDGQAYFYVIASTATGIIKKISTGGVIAWSSTAFDASQPQDMCFDRLKGMLVAVTASAPSASSLSLVDGSKLVSASPGAITTWHAVDCDGQGNFTFWRNALASGDVMGTNSSFSTIWGPTTFANTTHTGASVNKGPIATPNLAGVRNIVGLAVANGTLVTFSASGVAAVTGGSNNFTPNAPIIFSAPCAQQMFYVDGAVYRLYDPRTNTLSAWVASPGKLPTDANSNTAKLIALWNGRIVLAGLPKDGHNWFMSAQLLPLNWDYSPPTTSTTQATSGNNSPAGLVGDVVNCLIPYRDDTLVFGCTHSIWQMTGDPMEGGQITNISQSLGMAWGRPFAIDPIGQIYFMGSDRSIYKMVPGALPVRVSQGINRLFQNTNLAQNIVRLEWDMYNQGLAVFITPWNYTGAANWTAPATQHYFWEERTNSWWPVVFTNVNHDPIAAHVYDGDDIADQVVMFGGRDGYIRIWSETATTDDGTAINSFVFLGPLMTKDLDDILLKDLLATLGTGSGPVTWAVYVGPSSEAALASSPVVSGTWDAGRNPMSYVRRSGVQVYVKLSAANPWTLEKLRVRYAPQGRIRREGLQT